MRKLLALVIRSLQKLSPDICGTHSDDDEFCYTLFFDGYHPVLAGILNKLARTRKGSIDK